jgi:hypothetical protein
MRKLGLALAVGSILMLGWSPSARALAYTISASVAFSNGGISGTISPVANLAGTTSCLAGSCLSTASQDWLVVSLTLNGGSGAIDQVGMSAAGVLTVVGVGYFTDPSETPTAGSIPIASQGLLNYDWPNISAGNLQAGETSDRLFVAFSPVGSLPGPGVGPIPPGTASFMLSKSGGANFSVQGSIVLVPEPGTLLLIGAGLLWIGIVGRQRR